MVEIYIPESVIDISGDSFVGCDSLESITVSPNNPAYTSDGTKLIRNIDY